MYWTAHLSGGPKLKYQCAVAVNTKIFVFGSLYSESEDKDEHSENNQMKPNDIHVLDTVKMKWLYLNLKKEQDLSCVPSKCYGQRVVAHNSKIYIRGGHYFDEMGDFLFCFDTNTLEWTKPKVYGNIPPPIVGQSMCIVKNCIYLHGGLERGGEYDTNVYMINLETMTWNIFKTTGDTPRTYFSTVTVVENKIYVFGGSFRSESAEILIEIMSNNVHCLDTTTGRWECLIISQLEPSAQRFQFPFSHNGYFYIFGGISVNMTFQFQYVHRYDPKTSTWIVICPKGIAPLSRRGMICTVINDKLFISGGIRSSSELNQLNIMNTEFKYEDDVHVLDINPNLYNMCLVNYWNYMEENSIDINDLRLPLLLKKDLAAVGRPD